MQTQPQNLRMALWAPIAMLAMALSGCATQMTVPLNWKPTTDIAQMQVKIQTVDLAGATVKFDKLVDARKDKALIGEQPGKEKKSVFTKDDVGYFVARNIADSVARLTPGSGLRITEQSPAVIVSGEVLEFFVTEDSNYDAVVRLHLLVKKADGTQLYEVNTVGKAQRLAFPRFDEDNYLRELSNAILEIARSLVEDPALRKALKGG